MIEIREKILTKFFYQRKDGKMGIGFHKSVSLTDDSIIRYDRKNKEWKFSKERWDRKISKSLMRGNMVESDEEGKMRVDLERYSDFKKFSERMVVILGVENFMEIIKFLK